MLPNNDHKCGICSRELKYGVEKIIQTCERSISGVFHNDCYRQKKQEIIERCFKN